MALGPRVESSPRLSELVADRLLALIGSGELAEGSRLPPEREVAEMLGVSRTIVREGLAALQLAGLIERRRGAGTVIKRVIGSPNVSSLRDQVRAGASIVELLDARLAVELGITHLLVEQKDRDFSESEGLLSEMIKAVREHKSVDEYMEPSFDFHVALACATEQSLLVSFVEGIYEQMRPHLWLISKSYTLEVAEQSLQLHEQILTSIRDRDAITALAAVKRHYQRYPALQNNSPSRAQTGRDGTRTRKTTATTPDVGIQRRGGGGGA